MKSHHTLSPLLAILLVSGLTACGQTGPLFRPDDKASLEKYDPRNDYRIRKEDQAADAKDAPAQQPADEAKTTPLSQDDAPTSTAPVVPAAQSPAAPQKESVPEAHRNVTPQAATAPAPVTPKPTEAPTPTLETAVPETTPVSSIPAPANNSAAPWSGIQWTPYRAEGAAP